MAAASAGATQTGFLSGAIASSPSHLQQHHSGKLETEYLTTTIT